MRQLIKRKIGRILFSVLAVLSLLQFSPAMAQEPVRRQINGTIREEGTGKPIRNISVFFDGTQSGTSSDENGRFTLFTITNVKLPIVATGVGYYSKTIKDYSLEKEVSIELKIRTYELDAVVIKADDGMSLKEKLKIFRREFLGTSAVAKNCEIQNESDLRFTYSSDTRILKATSDKPLIIHNKDLGYTLTFLLTSFSYDKGKIEYYGSQFFKEDEALADIEKIEKARKNSYRGSRMHFIRSLWENDMEINGFNLIWKSTPLPHDSLVIIRGDQKYIRLFKDVDIAYRWRTSPLWPVTPGKEIYIEKNGYTAPIGLIWGGLMAEQRTGDTLPLEYDEKVKPGQSR